MSDQQCDSHEGRFRQVSLECFIIDRSTPCLRGVGVKARSGKEDTTLLSMAVCRVKQENVSTATRYGIKPRIQGCPRGSVRMGGQRIRYHKKKNLRVHGCKQLKVELDDGRTVYYEVADDRLKSKDKKFIWNMGLSQGSGISLVSRKLTGDV